MVWPFCIGSSSALTDGGPAGMAIGYFITATIVYGVVVSRVTWITVSATNPMAGIHWRDGCILVRHFRDQSSHQLGNRRQKRSQSPCVKIDISEPSWGAHKCIQLESASEAAHQSKGQISIMGCNYEIFHKHYIFIKHIHWYKVSNLILLYFLL